MASGLPGLPVKDLHHSSTLVLKELCDLFAILGGESHELGHGADLQRLRGNANSSGHFRP